ncbi:MAG: threonine/serine dehydratase [Planctomycetota bacterium]|nr:threonine/serine dehydratase [Planctomycetota bacterium]
MDIPIDLESIQAAADRIAPYVVRTPVLTSHSLDQASGASVFLKCENFQKIGAFKFRGAMNAVLLLDDSQRKRGVITHSSGNHGQALAKAGQMLGVPVCVVMPSTAPAVKRRATEDFGAIVELCEPTQQARESTVQRLIDQHGYEMVHPFNDWRVIAGQGTAALELLEQSGPLDVVIAPIGGGGLASGTSIAVKSLSPGTRVIGVEPARADDAMRSMISGKIESSGDPKTMADGLRTSLGDKTFAVIQKNVDEIVTATEEEMLAALRFVWERFKIIIEPSCAVPVAPVLHRNLDLAGKRVGIIITGGNVDLDAYFDSLKAKFIES